LGIEGKGQTSLKGSAGSDAGRGCDQFNRQMLRLYRAGASIAHHRKLRRSGQGNEEKADSGQQILAKFHLIRL
jgi:hypothetical protein